MFALLLGFAVYFWFDARAAEREAKTNYNLAIDQAASNVDLIVDNYQAGRIATNLITLLIERPADRRQAAQRHHRRCGREGEAAASGQPGQIILTSLRSGQDGAARTCDPANILPRIRAIPYGRSSTKELRRRWRSRCIGRGI